jgi:hypothetical protein
LRLFENRVLKRIIGCRREFVAGGWRRLHDEELHNVHASHNIIWVVKWRKVRWKMNVEYMGEMRNSHVGKSEGKRPCRRPRHRWEGNIRMNLREIVWEDVDWIHLAQYRDQWQVLVNAVKNLQVP